MALQLTCLTQADSGDSYKEIEKSGMAEAGTPIRLRASYSRKLKKPTVLRFATSQGELTAIPNSPDEMMLFTTDVSGPVEVSANLAEANSQVSTVKFSFLMLPAKAQPISGQIGVTLQRSASIPTPDLGLWAAIRAHEKAISFGGLGKGPVASKGYQDLSSRSCAVILGDWRCRRIALRTSSWYRSPQRKIQAGEAVASHGMAAYELLKTATEIFLLWNCGVAIRTSDAWRNPLATPEEESARTGIPVGQVITMLTNFLGTRSAALHRGAS